MINCYTMDDGLFRLHLGDETFGPYKSVGIIYKEIKEIYA